MIFFLDSSALVKRYIDEEGTSGVLNLLADDNRLVVARLAFVELYSACARRVRNDTMTPEQWEIIAAAIDSHFREEYQVIELGGAVMDRAAQLACTRYLRAADAIQLACALVVHSEADKKEFRLVSCDEELNSAAQIEGLQVCNPLRD